ncbi:reverse transcriptase domain-containing protein [Tanacetum coccineum]
MEAQYGKFLDMICVVQINVPLVDVFARMPNYGKFLKELVSNKHKLEKFSSAFVSDESSAIIQNKVPPKLENPINFIILEMEEDSKVTLILGRPFLHTADVVIRVKQKQLNLGVGFEQDKIFAEFDEFITMNIEENTEPEINEEEIPFEKIAFDTDYKIKKSLDEPPTDLELKPLPDHLEYAFLEEHSLLLVIISS